MLPVVDAAPSVTAPSAPVREGCSRSGSIEGLENDPACLMKQVSEAVMRTSISHLTTTVTVEPLEVVSGSMALVTVTIKNTSEVETLVVLEAMARPPGPRPDWSRVTGIPEPRAAGAESTKIFFTTSTRDAAEHDVDDVPIVPNSSTPSLPVLVGSYLRPGAKLTHAGSWWALRIPAPAPIFKDDAGHRYVPKTSAVPLFPGEYSAIVEVPFYGLSREERRFPTRLRVVKTPLPDGGVRR